MDNVEAEGPAKGSVKSERSTPVTGLLKVTVQEIVAGVLTKSLGVVWVMDRTLGGTSPRRTPIVLSPLLATTRSGRPSPLRSAAASAAGLAPVANDSVDPKGTV